MFLSRLHKQAHSFSKSLGFTAMYKFGIAVLIMLLPLLSKAQSSSAAGNVASMELILVDDNIIVDSAEIEFPIAQSTLDINYRNNGQQLQRLLDAYTRSIARDNTSVKGIEVTGSASPDGSAQFNYLLSQRRAQAIFDFLSAHVELPDSITRFTYLGRDWKGLYNLIEADQAVPARARVLDLLSPAVLIDSISPVAGNRLLAKLKTINNGQTYRYLSNNIFPRLRNSRIAVVFRQVTYAEPAPGEVDESCPLPEAEEIIIAEEDIVSEPVLERVKLDNFALKTNLLYDAALLPSLELEYLINPHWGVAAEANVAWWNNANHHKTYRLGIIAGEGRYYFRPRNRFHGPYVGVFSGGTWYDLQHRKGYKGEGGFAGASIGYIWPISRHLSLEAGLGVGYLYTRYKVYEHYDGHNIYQRTKTLNYFGPLKLKFSIAWRFSIAKYNFTNPTR